MKKKTKLCNYCKKEIGELDKKAKQCTWCAEPIKKPRKKKP
jgi:hypothetical protein